MSWNYRVLKHERAEDDFYYIIHEVYYDKSGNATSWTVDAVQPWGENMEELELSMKHYNSALDKPVLLVSGDKLIEIEE
jgi:hypothetical protein